MTRLPVPGSDDGQWGAILNAYLSVEHTADGTLKLRTDGTLGGLYTKPGGGIPASDLSAAVQAQLAQAGGVRSVNGKAADVNGAIVIAESDIGSLSADLAAKAADAVVVHLNGSETIAGAKTFSAGIVTAALQLTASPVAGYALVADSAGRASWQDVGGANVAFAVALG